MRIAMTVLAVLILIVIGWQVLGLRHAKTASITLTFHAKMGEDPLMYDQFIYENPGGEGLFRVRDFRFYLSNLTVADGGESYAEPDSYHLLRFDNADTTYSIRLEDVPLRSVETIRFLIGIDPAANHSIKARGDLDPNSQMAWNWEVGYKFVAFEGALKIGETVSPLVYHVGFSENAREVALSLTPGAWSDDDQVHLDVDLTKLFEGATLIDIEALPSVKFNRADSAVLADNYATMIALAR